MGENKGHGVKGPRHDNDIDDLSMNQGGQQQSGNMQSGQQQGNQQSGQQQQQGKQQSDKQQQGSQQSGQQPGSQQSGGQHASGGTPALDDLGSRQGESAKDASQAWSQDNSADKQRGNR
jgi:Ca-activated chloride channel family protein